MAETSRLRRYGLPLAGAALFLLACAFARGGLFGAGGYGDADLYGGYAYKMASGLWPYRDFYDEYPVGAQPLFLVVQWLPGSFVGALRWVMALSGAGSVAIMLMLRPSRVAAVVAGVAPFVVGPVFLNTYDAFPALLTVAAVAAWVHRRDRNAWVLVALAVAVKIFAIVLVPFMLLEARERGAFRRAVAWIAGVLVVLHLPFAVMGPGGLRFSYWVQLRRGLESESLGGGVLLVLHRLGLVAVTLKDEAPGSRDLVGSLPRAVAGLSTLALVVAVAAIWVLYRRGPRDRFVAAAAAVTAFVTFDKVLSPQYLTWLVPLVPGVGVDAAVLLFAALVLTRLEWERFMQSHGGIPAWGNALAWWILARDLVLVTLLAATTRRIRR